MSGQSLITVGVTCHNASDTIVRAVESALSQDWMNLEVVVVDDCSSDESWNLLKGLEAQDNRIRVVRHDRNRGYPGALNTIMSSARGEFVALVDDDDQSVSDRLTAQHARILDYERTTGATLVLCYSNRDVVKSGKTAVDHVAPAIGRRAPEPFGPAVADHLLSIRSDPAFVWGMFGSCTLMARRSSLLAIGPFDESFRRCAEWDMAIRGALMGAHFIAVDRSLVTQFKTRSTDKAGKIPLKYSLMLREKYRSYLSGKHLYLASRAMACAGFYGSKGKPWRSRFFLAMACVLGPSLAVSGLRRRMARVVSGAR